MVRVQAKDSSGVTQLIQQAHLLRIAEGIDLPLKEGYSDYVVTVSGVIDLSLFDWRYVGGSFVERQTILTVCDDSGDRYRNSFKGLGELNEISGLGNHNTAKYWEYDTRLGRRWNIDPVDQISVSNYATFANNPIVYVDPTGDHPREGNKVVDIDFSRSFITKLGYVKPSFDSADKKLNSSAWDHVGHVSSFGPSMPGPKLFKTIAKIKSHYNLIINDAISVMNRVHTWVQASKSHKVYNYVEFTESSTGERLIIERQIKNYNKDLGVKEGYENVVTKKVTYKEDNNGDKRLIKKELWSFRKDKKAGKVIYEHFEFDFDNTKRRKKNGGSKRSGEIEAKPAIYSPTKNK